MAKRKAVQKSRKVIKQRYNPNTGENESYETLEPYTDYVIDYSSSDSTSNYDSSSSNYSGE